MASTVSAKDRDRLMANGLVHKIRNSLNAMRAHLALLQKFSSSEEPRVPQQIHRLEQSVAGLEELIKEYLTLESPEKDHWQEVDLVSAVQEVLRFAALDLEQGKVTIHGEFDPKDLKVYVDRDKLKRAILNLVVNARQAMPEGGQLTVRAQHIPRGHVVLEICDTGCGIPEEERGRIFQPFFSTKPGGYGLGLSVVKRIIEDFRGQIGFDSQVAQGTTFRIVLPTARRQRAALERQARHQQWLQAAL